MCQGFTLCEFCFVLNEVSIDDIGRIVINEPTVNNSFAVAVCKHGFAENLCGVKRRRSGQSDLYRIEILDNLLIFAHVIFLVIIEDFFLGHLSVKNVSSVSLVNDNQVEGTRHQIGSVGKNSALEQTLHGRYTNLGFKVDIVIVNGF